MMSPGTCFVKVCEGLHGVPARIFCFLVLFVQGGTLDYYLVSHLGNDSFAWIAFDIAVAFAFGASFLIVSMKRSVELQRSGIERSRTVTICWLAWLAYAIGLIARMVISFDRFAFRLDENDFFGPNTFKTALALAAVVFVFLLVSHHDAPVGSERRRYIEELTGTVIFDVLDTVDILEILFDKEARDAFPPGMKETIFATASFNLLLPTVPLITLSMTNFGRKKMPKRLVALHKLFVALAINVPNLMVRMILWHGFSFGISAFSLKNIIIICIVLYEFYEHKKEKVGEDKYNLDKHAQNSEFPSSYNQSFPMDERV